LTVDFEIFEKLAQNKKTAELIFAVFATYFSVMASIAAIIYSHKRFKDRLEFKQSWFKGFYLAEAVLLLIFLLVLNHYLFERHIYPKFLYSSARRGEILNISLILGLYSSAAIAFGIMRGMAWLRYFGLAVLAVALVKVMFYDLAGLELSYRVVSFLALGGLLIGLSFLYQRFKDRLEGLALPEGTEKSEVEE